MKTKKLSKKLTLNKSTITNINTPEMAQVKGGGTFWDTACISCSFYTYCSECYCPSNHTFCTACKTEICFP
jgi:hypothetical protein